VIRYGHGALGRKLELDESLKVDLLLGLVALEDTSETLLFLQVNKDIM
jgi:hypothetical protein